MRDIPERFELAPQARLDAVEHLAPRFFREVIGWAYEDCLVTDESDLYDFTDLTGDQVAEAARMLDRMEAYYAIDGRAANSTRIVELLQLLSQRGVTS